MAMRARLIHIAGNWRCVDGRVDDMRAPYGRMVMCHMLADTDAELHAMADRIGVSRRWHQKAGTHHSHYDISLSKRAQAVAAGAIEITMRDTGLIVRRKRATCNSASRRAETSKADGNGFAAAEDR